MAAMCIRPTDCLAGRAFFGAQRGVLGAPRRPVQQQQQQSSQFPAMASPPVHGQPRAARGRPSGRQRGRRSPTATGSPPHKRVMENVVILKRGEQIPPVVTAAPPAGCQDGVQAEKATEPVAVAAKQSDVQAEKAAQVAAAEHRGTPAKEDEPAAAAEEPEPMAAADQRAQAENVKAAEAVSAETVNAEAVAAVDQSVPKTKEEEEEPSAATSADQSSALAAEPDAAPAAAYSGPAFVAAPEPRALPIPVLLLKRRGAAARPRARDDGLAGATAAAA